MVIAGDFPSAVATVLYLFLAANLSWYIIVHRFQHLPQILVISVIDTWIYIININDTTKISMKLIRLTPRFDVLSLGKNEEREREKLVVDPRTHKWPTCLNICLFTRLLSMFHTVYWHDIYFHTVWFGVTGPAFRNIEARCFLRSELTTKRPHWKGVDYNIMILFIIILFKLIW